MIEDADYPVFELLSKGHISVGDKLQGDLKALSDEGLVHLSRGWRSSAYGQRRPSCLAACRRLLS